MNSIKNIAIVMDGNGRWASDRIRPRVWGHIRGSNKVSEIVLEATRLEIDSLTLYAFSTENWKRPADEVKNLFKLLRKFLKKEKAMLKANNIKFNVIGNYRALDQNIVEIIDEITEETSQNSGLKLSLAINYGGRAEIVDSVNRFFEDHPNKKITQEDISRNLYNPSVSDVDLLIRTAGDRRISNFLLWQVSYSELYFTETKWPDFSKEEFRQALSVVKSRDRRFGGIEKNAIFNYINAPKITRELSQDV